MERVQQEQLQEAYGEIARKIKESQESGNVFFNFMGSGAALGTINDAIDLALAAHYDDGGESRGKAVKAAIMLFIHLVLVAYWWYRQYKVH